MIELQGVSDERYSYSVHSTEQERRFSSVTFGERLSRGNAHIVDKSEDEHTKFSFWGRQKINFPSKLSTITASSYSISQVL